MILTQGAKHCTIDLKYFYLQLGLLEYEHVRTPLSTKTLEFEKAHNVYELIDYGVFTHAEVQ